MDKKKLTSELLHAAFQFKKLMSAGFGMDTAANKSDINISELIFMKEISENSTDSVNNVGLSDICRLLSISKPAVSQMLRSLEKKGYINRDIDKNNRRNLIVTLTHEGRGVLAERYAEHIDKFESIIAHLGEDDVKQMIVIINRMAELTNMLNKESEKSE